jgi:hypothetical protein
MTAAADGTAGGLWANLRYTASATPQGVQTSCESIAAHYCADKGINFLSMMIRQNLKLLYIYICQGIKGIGRCRERALFQRSV